MEDTMPNIKSQKKRVITNKKAQERNVAKRSTVRTAIKKFEAAVAANDVELAKSLLPVTISALDVAKNDGIYKDNTVSRKISRLNKMLLNIANPELVNAKKAEQVAVLEKKNPIK